MHNKIICVMAGVMWGLVLSQIDHSCWPWALLCVAVNGGMLPVPGWEGGGDAEEVQRYYPYCTAASEA